MKQLRELTDVGEPQLLHKGGSKPLEDSLSMTLSTTITVSTA